MLDLETLGKSTRSAVVGIGAVVADASGILSTFSSRIDPRSSEKAGLLLDADTLCWWLQQSEDARREIWEAKEKLPDALDRLTAWVSEWGGPEVQVWGNGSDFDNVIIEAAYQATDRRLPWRWTRNRCFRTVKAVFGADVPEPTREGTRHNPVDDATHQMKHLLAILAAKSGPVVIL